ncbi:hypothetical protein [Nocardia flavorosea]|uniref:RHIM domain-containing protein n=1 Tax=Nocardia flavorosea TaxID=53429 RepID=A0A846YTU2_9NOCA|nr:hypothetical protein [Nocardia flavorosea]NKY60928.1 hypothetical protein [Nocardia flavorosea]
MDPVTAVVVSAIAAGAAAGVSDTAAQVVKDAYLGLKDLISRNYRGVDVSGVERKPESESKQASLAEDLDDAGAAGDAELGAAAVAVLQAVQQHHPQVVGADVSGLVAAVLEISDIASAGDGVRVTGSEIAGTVKISGVRAGFPEAPDPGTARP